MERIGSKTRLRGQDRRRFAIDEFRYADGATADARGRRPSRGRRDGRPRRARSSTWCASRARRWARTALLELPAGKLDVEGESPARVRQARARRGDRQGGVAVARAEALLHQPRVRRGGGDGLSGDRASSDAERRVRRGGADRGRAAGRSSDLDRAIEECRGREVADRAAAASRRAEAESATHGAGCTGRGAAAPGRTSCAWPIAVEQAGVRRARSTRASRRWCSTSSRTWSSSAGWRATRSTPTAPTCSSSAPSWPSATAAPPRPSAPTSPTSSPTCADAATASRRVLAGDDQPQDGLPALLLPAPAPRGADRRRPDGGARRPPTQEPQAARACSATPR